MTEQLKNYMVELATNVDRLAEFMRDPKTALESSGLDEADRATLASGDQGRIYSALKDLPTPPAAPPTPPPQLPMVVASQYPYGVPGQAAAAGQSSAPQGAVPQGQYPQAAPWPAGSYAQPAAGGAYYVLPPYYVPAWPTQGYCR